VIDLLDIYNDEQKKFVDLILKKEPTDQDRTKALNMVEDSSKRIDGVVKAITKECGCILLNRNAVINPEALRDYTQEAKMRMTEKR